MVNRVHVLLLRIYRRLPIGARRLLIRVLSPSFTVGAICLIERDDGAVLLVRQVYRARWGLPGGLLKRRRGCLPSPSAVRSSRRSASRST